MKEQTQRYGLEVHVKQRVEKTYSFVQVLRTIVPQDVLDNQINLMNTKENDDGIDGQACSQTFFLWEGWISVGLAIDF